MYLIFIYLSCHSPWLFILEIVAVMAGFMFAILYWLHTQGKYLT